MVGGSRFRKRLRARIEKLGCHRAQQLRVALAKSNQRPAKIPCAAASAPQKPGSTRCRLDGIQKFYAEAQDLTAQFEQVYTYTVYGRKQKSNGVVYFKKPGMMRWDYRRPTPKVFVADGKRLGLRAKREPSISTQLVIISVACCPDLHEREREPAR